LLKALFLLSLVLVAPAGAQTTQGLLVGRVTDSRSGAAVAGVRIAYHNRATHSSGYVISSPAGRFAIFLLPPGEYRLRLTANSYQTQEVQNLEVPVAGRREVDFQLRPLQDVWEKGEYRNITLPKSDLVVTLFGPDLDSSRTGQFLANPGTGGALESTLSSVIDPVQLGRLPLAGRDAYTMLITQPGVTAEAGTTRGLGLSVNGQRSSASNFLLDGVENNNALVTGPLAAIAPEAIQEYRISTNNFSAEFGRTSGFVANAVTRAGSNQWHGLGYANLKNDALNANSFERNRLGQPRTPQKEQQFGGQTGGRLKRDRLFASFALEQLRSRGYGESQPYTLPATGAWGTLASSSIARRLLDQYPALVRPVSRNLTEVVNLRPPATLNRTLGLARLDANWGRQRLMLRYSANRTGNPNFIWTPYPDFVSGLEQQADSVAGALESMPRANMASELRWGWSHDRLAWDRAHPEIPTLYEGSFGTTLPGSPAAYAYRNQGHSWQISESVSAALGAHIVKAGGGIFWRNPGGELTAGRDGLFVFQDFLNFSVDKPDVLQAALDRSQLPRLSTPNYQRQWRQSQWYGFIQDTWRISRRLVVNYGLRYDSFGAPTLNGTGVYRADRNDFQPRFGLTWSPRANSRWLVRGAYGIFQDRPFDNLWQNTRNNGLTIASLAVEGRFNYNYLAPLSQQLPTFQGQRFGDGFPNLTRIDPNLRNAYVQTWFAGVQGTAGSHWSIEANTTGSLGRKLITTDILNRARRDNPALPEIAWRSTQGSSNYLALHGVVRYRNSRGFAQAAYTWSHAIDNQSEPLAGDFFDLNFSRVASGALTADRARFLRPGDSRGDRGSADFDQRHNLVVYSVWQLPAPRALPWLRGISLSEMAAFRTGFPFSVTASDRRADVTGPGTSTGAVAGGVQWLDPAAFRFPTGFGNSGRNAFRGPGLYNVDFSLAKTVTLRERWRATLRADAYNVLNHANLNNPQSSLFSPDFGIARYGRRGRETGFPALVPFAENARQVQLIVRFEF
jgi:hypothetical protein